MSLPWCTSKLARKAWTHSYGHTVWFFPKTSTKSVPLCAAPEASPRFKSASWSSSWTASRRRCRTQRRRHTVEHVPACKQHLKSLPWFRIAGVLSLWHRAASWPGYEEMSHCAERKHHWISRDFFGHRDIAVIRPPQVSRFAKKLWIFRMGAWCRWVVV